MSDGELKYPGLPARDAKLVVPVPTAASAQEAVNEFLDSADEADMREMLNTQGDLHERGSSEANAEANQAAAKTADEVAVDKAYEDLVIELDRKIDAYSEAVLASPEVNAMIEAALEDEDQPDKSVALTNVYKRLAEVEKKVSIFEKLLNEFKDRALKAFDHAGFKF